jgi:hypothetical protein
VQAPFRFQAPLPRVTFRIDALTGAIPGAKVDKERENNDSAREKAAQDADTLYI